MGVALSDAEAWRAVEEAHTGILTSLRRDGRPVSLPVWFVAFARHVYVSTPTQSKKLARIRHDPRVGFLVESGDAWKELRAVHLSGTATVVEDEEVTARVRELLDRKYEGFRTPYSAMTAGTQRHYADMTVVQIRADSPIVSWDNRRLRIGE